MNVCLNGDFFPAEAPLLPVHNRSYKWGDGVFETMKVFRGKLLLENLHFERLLTSLRILQIGTNVALHRDTMVAQVLELCRQNDCSHHARVRLAVYRTEENAAGYSIEALPLDDHVSEWSEEGLNLVLFPYARKSMDAFANLKSANFLPYVMAQRHATERGADDALVINAQNHLCDSSKANLFLIKDEIIYTPALHQGCVNGVMRRVVIDEAKKMGFRLHQDEVTEEQVIAAGEVFLTNAIQIIRWVARYKDSEYGFAQTRQLFTAVKATIFRGLC
ncbi:aminotransferase class IV [Flavisolibacter nicotianae]|uniref:aminotransferase class IV n=1 Tax=Flavisolibacter nicotianae TaxID=2364882 RepID=UPI000EADBB56|nr:aminotransferase class IV [Flavisolibacter nicotianae]